MQLPGLLFNRSMEFTMTSTVQRLLEATSPPPPQRTTSDASSVSYRLTPAEIALLQQGKKAITDYVQAELPARLALLGLAHVLHKP
jgi:hypothetical protein